MAIFVITKKMIKKTENIQFLKLKTDNFKKLNNYNITKF